MSCWRSFAAVVGALAIASLAAAPQARAAIAVVNQIGDGLGNAGIIGGAPWLPASPYYNVNQPLTVTGGNVLVVELGDRQSSNPTALPTSLTWDGVTLNEAVTQVSTASSYRLVATYWAPISVTTATTANITGTIPDGTDLTGSWLTAFTLSGVDTSKPILTGGTDGQATSETVTVNNVAAGSYAAVNYVFGNAAYTVNVSGNSGTPILWTENTQGSSSTDQGYIANLSGGSNAFTANELAGTGAGTPYKSPLAVAVFTPLTNALTWTGTAGNANWNTSDANWSGSSTKYFDGATLVFSDSGINTNITITSAVQPAGLIFTNSSTPYTFGGAAIAGSASVTLSGGGIVTLNNANTYTGSTLISAGTLAVTGLIYAGSSTSTVGAITVNNGGVLQVAAGGKLYPNLNKDLSAAITVNTGGGLVLDSWALQDSLGTLYFNAPNLVINGGTVSTVGKSNTTDLSGGGRAFTIGPAGATLNSASAGQTWSIVPYILGAADDYPLVSNGGLLTLTGVGNGLISKAIPGSGGVTMAGAGTWTLGGSNTYSGPTTINQGKLLVDGWLTSSAVAVNSGGTLGGTGDVTSVTVNPGGHIAPGDALGALNVSGNLTLLAGAAMDFALDSPGIGYDQLDISGLATLGGTLNIGLVSGFSPSYGENFDVLIGSTSGSFSQTNLPALGSGLQWDASNLYTSGVIAIVPEPSSMLLLGAGIITLLGFGFRLRLAIAVPVRQR